MQNTELINQVVTILITTISGAIIRALEKRKLRKEGKLIDKGIDKF
jgi:hypothetical protein